LLPSIAVDLPSRSVHCRLIRMRLRNEAMIERHRMIGRRNRTACPVFDTVEPRLDAYSR
jgi:hypothetical protein